MTRRGRRPASAPLLAAAGAAIIALAIWLVVRAARSGEDEPARAGWLLEAGRLSGPEGAPAAVGARLARGSYTAAGEAKLARGSSSIRLLPGSSIELDAGGEILRVSGPGATLEIAEPTRVGYIDLVPIER